MHLDGAMRIFHGRGKSIPNLDYVNIDFFPPYVLIILYREPELGLLADIQTNLLDLFFDKIKGIAVQRRYLSKAPLEITFGDVPEEYECHIEDSFYHLKFGHAQNMGFFLDMKEGRDFLRENANGKRVLNLFSYTCALSVVALKSGASHVVNFDMSKAAIARGRHNHKINQIELNKVKFFDHDIFKSFARIKKEGFYDIVIIDPPSDHGEHFNIERDYPKLIKRVPDWLNSNGFLITCLNSPHLSFDFLENLVKQNCSGIELIKKLGSPTYFNETNPDNGLKILIWKKYE